MPRAEAPIGLLRLPFPASSHFQETWRSRGCWRNLTGRLRDHSLWRDHQGILPSSRLGRRSCSLHGWPPVLPEAELGPRLDRRDPPARLHGLAVDCRPCMYPAEASRNGDFTHAGYENPILADPQTTSTWLTGAPRVGSSSTTRGRAEYWVDKHQGLSIDPQTRTPANIGRSEIWGDASRLPSPPTLKPLKRAHGLLGLHWLTTSGGIHPQRGW